MERVKTFLLQPIQDKIENNLLTKIGGRPTFISDIKPPKCKCGKEMKFVGQVLLDSPINFLPNSVAYIFMCEGTYSENGLLLCETWDYRGGANKVIIQTGSNELRASILLKEITEPSIDVSDYSNEETLVEQISEETKIGGVPYWLQDNETPRCKVCGIKMSFICQINSNSINDESIDFGGGGLGYTFLCINCREAGFLWQCD
jgi:uncharacterized protein YwqG